MLQEIIRIAQESDVVFGSLHIIGSTHSVANVNVQKDDRRQKKGERPRDPSGQWGVKHTRTVRDEKGHKRKVGECFYGYKMHTSLVKSKNPSRKGYGLSHAATTLYMGCVLD